MASLFPPTPPPDFPKPDKRALPPPIRQAIVDAHAEYPELSLHEIASICYVQFGRKPSPHTIQYILATGPKPSRTTHRYKRFAEIDDPVERRRTILKLHSDRERRDNRHSPQDVLRGVLARTVPEPVLARIFFATHFTRHLDRSGHIRFRRWRFYAEAGLAKQSVTVHLYTSTLKIEYQDTDLAFYTMEWEEDNKRIKEVKNPRVIETGYRSPQLTLWTLGPDEWLLFLKLPDYAARKKQNGKQATKSSPRSGDSQCFLQASDLCYDHLSTKLGQTIIVAAFIIECGIRSYIRLLDEAIFHQMLDRAIQCGRPQT